MLRQRLKQLQDLKSDRTNLEWVKEVVKTCLFYNDVEQAKNFLKYSEFANKDVEYLSLYINTYSELKNDKFGTVKMEELMENEIIFETFDIFSLFVELLYHFKQKEYLNMIYDKHKKEDILELFHIRALYKTTKSLKYLKLIIEMDDYITKEEYEAYAKRRGIKRSEVLRIFKATNAQWAYDLLCFIDSK